MSRYLFILALVLFLLVLLLVITNHQGFSIKILNVNLLFLVLAAIVYIIEAKYEK